MRDPVDGRAPGDFQGGGLQDTMGLQIWGKEMRPGLGKEETACGVGEKHGKKTAEGSDQEGPSTWGKQVLGQA